MTTIRYSLSLFRRQVPLVFVHGLGVGLVPYFMLIFRLSKRHSGDLFVPEFPFLAMAPWESVPSAREVVAQLQARATHQRECYRHTFIQREVTYIFTYTHIYIYIYIYIISIFYDMSMIVL